jgi:hypothetical protein
MIKRFVFAFTGMMSLFLAERCHGDQMTEYMVQGQTHTVRRGDLWFLCLLLHVLIHLLVWCHDSLHLVLELQACLIKVNL